ncbi:MAG TPA: hypothetical protein VGN34_28675 [Ktedonobacteraceae bacterium]|jgi:hypothetical protein
MNTYPQSKIYWIIYPGLAIFLLLSAIQQIAQHNYFEIVVSGLLFLFVLLELGMMIRSLMKRQEAIQGSLLEEKQQ